MAKKYALIVEGGGITGGAWCAGVLKKFFDYYGSYWFDAAYGYSAATYSLAYYAACQPMYIEHIWRNLACGLFSPRNFFRRGRHLLDLEWMEQILRYAPEQLDIVTLLRARMKLVYVLTEYPSGMPVYRSPSFKTLFPLLRGSASILLLHPPTVCDDVWYVDGGYSDPLPVKKAVADGYDVVIISPRARGESISASWLYPLYKTWLYATQPVNISRMFTAIPQKLREADEYIEKNSLPVVRPRHVISCSPITSDQDYINELVDRGLQDGESFFRRSTMP
jgi:predicted patatin/cPLA2 family phospholipase